MRFNLIYVYEQTEMMHRMLQEIPALQPKPQHIGHTVPVEEPHAAIHLFQSGETMGKVTVSFS